MEVRHVFQTIFSNLAHTNVLIGMRMLSFMEDYVIS